MAIELHGSELSKTGRIVKKVALYIFIYLLNGRITKILKTLRSCLSK